MRNVTLVRALFGLLALACIASCSARNARTTPANTNARALQLERSVNRMPPRQTFHNVLSK